MALRICFLITAAAFLFALANSVKAGTWTAVGILVTQNDKMDHFKAEFVRIDDFDSYEKCLATISTLAHSNEFIGKGGTNEKVSRIDWNYDADRVHVNDK